MHNLISGVRALCVSISRALVFLFSQVARSYKISGCQLVDIVRQLIIFETCKYTYARAHAHTTNHTHIKIQTNLNSSNLFYSLSFLPVALVKKKY